MCIPCLDPMKNPADLNTADLDTNKGLVNIDTVTMNTSDYKYLIPPIQG